MRHSEPMTTGSDVTAVESHPVRRSRLVRVSRACAVIGLCLLPAAVSVVAISTVTKATQICNYSDNIGVSGRIGALLALVILPVLTYLLAGSLLVLLRRWTQWQLGRSAVVIVLACAVAVAAFLWIAMGQYPTDICPDGVPSWWPSWVPVRGVPS
jgi:hypothetical protein